MSVVATVLVSEVNTWVEHVEESVDRAGRHSL